MGKNSESKMKHGQKKRNYKGAFGKMKRQNKIKKRKVQKHADAGAQVLFRVDDQVFLGFTAEDCVISGKAFKVQSEPVGSNVTSTCKYISQENNDVHLVLDTKLHMSPGNSALIVWENTPGIFTKLKPVKLAAPLTSDTWLVRPINHHIIKVDLVEVTSCPYKIDFPEDDIDAPTARQQDINLLNLFINTTIAALDRVNETHETCKSAIISSNLEKVEIERRSSELDHLYQEARKEVIHLKQILFDTTKEKNAQIRDLQDTISVHKSTLARYQKEQIAHLTEVRDVRMKYQIMEKQLTSCEKICEATFDANNRLSNEVTKLQEENAALQASNKELQQRMQITAAKSSLILEKRAGPLTEKGLLLTRQVGSFGKPTASMPLTIPEYTNPSSDASHEVLVSRADELHKVNQNLHLSCLSAMGHVGHCYL